MTIAYLNNQWLPLEEARISPLDRGFLYGDGIYEVIPVHHAKPVALNAHIERLETGLSNIGLATDNQPDDWKSIIEQIVDRNKSHSKSHFTAIYLHVSRGADTKRHHAFPKGITPTVFAFSFDIPPPPPKSKDKVNCLTVGLAEDLRWKRCHIKSTSLLGNVLHYQQGAEAGFSETILFNSRNEITEASACNVFAVIDGTIVTPPLDHQLLPGITRLIVIEALKGSDLNVLEKTITVQELLSAQEVWITSSTKEIAPISHVAGNQIGDGKAGPVWEKAINALDKVKFAL